MDIRQGSESIPQVNSLKAVSREKWTTIKNWPGNHVLIVCKAPVFELIINHSLTEIKNCFSNLSDLRIQKYLEHLYNRLHQWPNLSSHSRPFDYPVNKYS